MPFDPMTGEFFHGSLEAHRAATAGVGTLFAYAARPELLAGWVNGMMTQLAIAEGTTGVTMASAGTLLGTGAAGAVAALAVPVVGMVGVFAALGSGYQEARNQARNENTISGFAQGFVTGILDWQWHHAASRFGRRYLRINAADEAMDSIRVTAYNGGLKTGFRAGSALPAAAKKAYRITLRKLANRQDAGQWSKNEDQARLQQVDYVIALATAGLRHGVISPAK
ncbi:MAG: hypothetical protein ACOX1P_29845 [Thermoguttaceae bacterium]|jgi:hypothetical protein